MVWVGGSLGEVSILNLRILLCQEPFGKSKTMEVYILNLNFLGSLEGFEKFVVVCKPILEFSLGLSQAEQKLIIFSTVASNIILKECWWTIMYCL